MLLDITQKNDQLYVSYYNLNGETRFKIYDIEPKDKFIWQVCDENDKNIDKKITNWDGRPVKKVKSKFLNKYRMIEMIEGIGMSDQELIFGYNFPKTYFIDIEVEVTDSFPEPSKAANKITAICIVTPNRQCIILATKDLTKKEQGDIENKINNYVKDHNVEYRFEFKKFNSEYDLLYTFLKSIVRKIPMMTGWNYIKFDWAYIINRAKRIGIDPSIASPIDELFGRDEFPCHVGVMDYMEIYAKWDRTIDVKEDVRLDTVGEAVLGLRKVKYDGTIQDLYEKDYNKYIFYNAIDTIIVQLIHEKIKTMEIALTIAHMSRISVFRAGSPVSITESLLCREFLKKGKVMAKDPTKPPPKKEKYEGAFVKEPITGMHNAVSCFDFASLYPSIMRQMNISPESFIKKVSPDERKKEISDDKIVAITGAVYKSGGSILKDILSDLYAQRKEYKKKSFELQQKAYELEKDQ